MSKSHALAGLRAGYAVGYVALIEALTRVKDSFNSYPLGRLAQVGAIALVRMSPLPGSRAAVIATRERMVNGLAELGFESAVGGEFCVRADPERSGAGFAAALRETQSW